MTRGSERKFRGTENRMPFASFACSIGVTPYTAPETYENLDLTFKTDMWNAGCMLYLMLYETEPFLLNVACKEYIDMRKENSVRRLKTFRDNPSLYSYELMGFDLCFKLLVWDPKDRMTADEALKHPYAMGIHEFGQSNYFHSHA